MSSISSIPNSFSVVVKSDGVRMGGSSTGDGEGDGVNEKILILAAFSQQDHSFWVTSLAEAISGSVLSTNEGCYSNREKSIASRLFNSSEELLNNNLKSLGASSDMIGSSNGQINMQHNRSNALSHVCWHRNISICAGEIVEKEAPSLSGPLLRKFKNR